MDYQNLDGCTIPFRDSWLFFSKTIAFIHLGYGSPVPLLYVLYDIRGDIPVCVYVEGAVDEVINYCSIVLCKMVNCGP